MLERRYDATVRSVPGPWRPLPPPRTGLVGRDAVLDRVLARLSAGSARLVTLTGISGIGKTRVAFEAARVAGPDPPWLIELGPEDRSPTDSEWPASVPASGAGLLVLDCVLPSAKVAAAVALLLDTRPDLRLVVTAPLPLRLRGEHVVAVGPLALPAVGVTDPDELRADASVTLFCRLAESLDDRFALTAENAIAVADICRRLGGLPLALELAAARTAALPVATLRRLLIGSAALELLQRGPTDAPDRHRSVNAALSWSLAALPAPEQALLLALGVFPGAFSLDDVCVVSGGAVVAALDRLSVLLEAGLVTAVPCGSAEARFVLPPLVRDYARQPAGTGAGAASADGGPVPHPAQTGTIDLRTPSRLTGRELEVLHLLAAGDSNKEIGRRLSITPKTVMHHTVAIYRKLGVRSRTEAAAHAQRAGLLRPGDEIRLP